MGESADLIRRCMPSPGLDLAQVVRDKEAFEATVAAISEILDPELEAAAVWSEQRPPYRGIEGFRQMWLDWLEPWASYHVHVEDVREEGERVVVLVRDRGRMHGLEAVVELLAGSIWTLRAGKVTRVEFHGSREDLFEAGGLSSPPSPTNGGS